MYITSHLKWINKKSCARSEILFFFHQTHMTKYTILIVQVRLLFGFSNFKWAGTKVKSSHTSLSRVIYLSLSLSLSPFHSFVLTHTHNYITAFQIPIRARTLLQYGINTIPITIPEYRKVYRTQKVSENK